MMSRARQDEGAAPPAFVAGHSLGEYNALLAAGVFDFATGVRLVQRRGALMARVGGRRQFLRGFTFRPPAVPVISNVSAKPYEADLIRQTLSEQIGNSVRWLESILFLLEQPDPRFEEVGPGTVLTRLVGQITKKSKKL